MYVLLLLSQCKVNLACLRDRDVPLLILACCSLPVSTAHPLSLLLYPRSVFFVCFFVFKGDLIIVFLSTWLEVDQLSSKTPAVGAVWCRGDGERQLGWATSHPNG